MKNIFKFKPKIKKGHSLEEYYSKFSQDYVNLKLDIDNNINNLKPNCTYWEIDNKYYQINHKRIFKIIGIAIGCVGIITSITLPIVYTSLSKERYISYNFKYWNECESLNKLKTFVKNSVTPSNKDYIPKIDRIATFDMDGTLFGERSNIYIEWMMFADYYDLMVKNHSELQLPSKTFLIEQGKEKGTNDVTLQNVRDNIQTFYDTRQSPKHDDTLKRDMDLEYREAYGGALLFSYSLAGDTNGLSIEEYNSYVNDYLERKADAFNNLQFKDMFYKPMIEVVEFLQINNFDVYIVSGTDRFMIRDICNKHLKNIPSNKFIGMDVNLINKNNKIYRGSNLKYKNVEDVKVELITQEIGKHPVLSFGNSSGDSPMHEYTLSNPNYKTESFMVVADDLSREFGYKEDELKERIKNWGKYNKFSMKNDFKTIYGDNVTIKSK